MRVVIVGASGLLGGTLCPKLELLGNEVLTVGRSPGNSYQCNFSDTTCVVHTLNQIRPNVIINLVALTDVDFCESNPKEAFRINVQIVENIVNWIESCDLACHLIQISSDQVYDGDGPHSESQTMLSNYYAYSKYVAEFVSLRVSSTVLRTNFIGRSYRVDRQSFTDWIYNSVLVNKKLFLFGDVFFTPLTMQTLAEFISRIMVVRPVGVFNLGSRDGMSKAEFGLSFINKMNLSTDNISVISIDEADFMKTYRPCDMRMDTSKLERCLGIGMPTLEDEINRVVGDYNE